MGKGWKAMSASRPRKNRENTVERGRSKRREAKEKVPELMAPPRWRLTMGRHYLMA